MNIVSVGLLFGTALKSGVSPWPATFAVAVLISFIAYLAYTPRVDKRSPDFTTDKLPFIGSWGFFTRKWKFWKSCAQKSRTGNFSFWLGKHHVVALSGEAARKMFLDNHNLDFKSGSDLVGMGPDRLPLHDVHAPNFHNGRSYFQRRLLDLQKSEQLVKRLSRVTGDARAAVEALAKNPSGITRPFESCYPMVVAQGCRIVCTDEIPDNPKLLRTLMGYLSILLSNPSPHTVAVPWLPSIASMKRRYGRYGLGSLVSPIISRRMKKGSPRVDDALQTLVDNGDSKDYITNFFISILFIIIANASATTSIVLSNVANNPYWQDKIYNEIKAVTKAYSTNKNAPFVEQLDSIPLEAWESSFPSIDLCFKEAIRMWITFPMIRKNLAPYPIPIPGTNEVIPPGSFASYHTSEVHFDEELYPNPKKFDPNRFLDGREEFKKQTYGFLGWGQGRHPCLGIRWARLQQNINVVYFLSKYKWSIYNPSGQTGSDSNAPDPGLQLRIQCKYVSR